MILVDASAVSASRPGRDLFRELDLTVSSGDRIGVVGLNGCGKSTLLGVLSGEVEPDSGEVRRGRGVKVAVLGQSPVLEGRTLSDALAAGALDAGWEMRSVADRLGLSGLVAAPVETLSGGEVKRAALARALVADSDLLILDEPTNHLDIDAIAWLEEHLAAYRGGLVVVTHDRHFLDRVTNKVIELDRGEAFVHEGGYEAYLEGRAAREARAARAESTRANLARRELEWLRRGAPARTSKPKARIEAAERIVQTRPQAALRASDLPLPATTPRLGNLVVELRGVGHGFDGRPLFEGVDLSLDRRERLGVVGPNGAGKSTLLDIIAGRVRPSSGEVVVGSTARIGMYDQQGRELDPTERARDVVVGPHREPDWTDTALMEAFWFDDDAQWSPVDLLSGGERRRLQLLVTINERPNVLLLDEPTNDLDIDTLRQLEDMLEAFPGAVVVVSHDRAFLERVVSDVVVLGEGRAERRPGGYATYEEERRLRRRRGTAGQAGGRADAGRDEVDRPGPGGPGRDGRGPPAPGPNRVASPSTLRHRLREVERELASARSVLRELGSELEAAGRAGDHRALAELAERIEAAQEAATRAEEEWLELTIEAEERGLRI